MRLFARCVLVISSLLSGAPAYADLVCDGRPMPYGKVCCRGGSYCEPGHMCVQEEGSMRCLALNSPRACSGGGWCNKGSVCAPEGGCLSVESVRYCGGRQFCKAGFACLPDKTCLSVTSERYCGDGKYCEPGSRCVGDGKCQRLTASTPTPRFDPLSGGNAGKPNISDSCLSIGESKRVGGMLGECTKKNGAKGHYYFTMVRSTGAKGCPKEIEFDYLDRDDDEVYSFSTPFNVQTCDAPPVAIEVVNE